MRRSLIRWRVDPTMIVQKRLPQHIRKQQLRQQLWQEEPEDTAVDSKTPSIVVQLAQAAKRRQRQPQLWSNLLDQALANQAELTPQHMASVLQSMADGRFRHDALLDEFIRSLSYRADVRAMVTAMLAVDRLGLPTEALRTSFLQQLSGNCERLSFGDMRRVLMALARCWQSAPVHRDLLQELCGAIAEKAENCDPRDLIVMPQHLGRLRFPHAELLPMAMNAVATAVSSRLTILPLDLLRALDGLLLLLPLVDAAAREPLASLAMKSRLFASATLRQVSDEEVWRTGAQLLGTEIAESQVWSVWVDAAVDRREEGAGRAQRLGQIRRRIKKQWDVRHPPEGLELALRAALQQGSPERPSGFARATA